MTRFKRILPSVAMLLGFLGVVVCMAAAFIVWSIGSRLSRTNENLFDGIDKSLVAVRDRVLSAQHCVGESKITTEEIGQSLKDWTREETGKRLASRLDVAEKAARLALGLRQADQWLEISGASIQGVQQALVMGNSLGAPVDAALVDPLLDKLGALRNQLQQATETIDGIHERSAEIVEGESREERIDQAAQLALRVVITLGEIDSRLGESADGLADMQTKAQHLKSRSHSYIVIATICTVLLIAWMAAGQVSLCRHGWKGYHQSRPPA